MFVDLICFLVNQSHSNLQRCGISYVTFFTLLDGVFSLFFIKCEADEFKTELSAVVCDWRNIVEYFIQSFVEKPLVRILLDLDQVRHFQDFFLSLVAHSHAFSSFYRTNSVFFH